MALTGILPWDEAKVATYVLQQHQHNLARTGFLQAQRRPGRHEADLLLLAPALDTSRGHPAIWEKLLSHYSNKATHQGIARLYVDVPDQPLPVSSFSHVGFRVYTRQTIWRLPATGLVSFGDQLTSKIRPQQKTDDWELRRLYARVTPQPVQQAEGQQMHELVNPPILDWWQSFVRTSFVLLEKNQIEGCIRIGYGRRGIWLQIWADTTSPDPIQIHQLIRFALTEIWKHNVRKPIYLGVRDYHGALGTVLSDYGFAPFTDRAKMVKHLLQWVKKTESVVNPLLETVPDAVATPYIVIPDIGPESMMAPKKKV